MSLFKSGVAKDLDNGDILLEVEDVLGDFIYQFETGGIRFREEGDKFLRLGEHLFGLLLDLFGVQFEHYFFSSPHLLVGFEVSDQSPQLLVRLDISLGV